MTTFKQWLELHQSLPEPPIEDDGLKPPVHTFKPGQQVRHPRRGVGQVKKVDAHVHVLYPDKKFIIAHGHHELMPA